MDGSITGAQQLVDAVRDGGPDVGAVAHEVGASAAARGVPLHEVIDLVERAYAGVPDHSTVRAACVAWAEETSRSLHQVSCEDPLTSLSTVPHLRARLGDVYREASREGAGHLASDRHTLVVVELTRPDPANALESSLWALEVAGVLGTVFTGDETVAHVATGRFAVLARRDRADATTLALLGVLLRHTTAGSPPPRTWVEELPLDEDDVVWTMAGLTR